MINKSYKIVIVGAGPAGLAAALYLQKNGESDLLVIDKSTFPRYKCCAGYVTDRTKRCYESLGVDLKKCGYTLIRDFSIYHKYKSRLKIDNKFLYTNEKINRVQLDYELFNSAKRQGIDIDEGVRVASHDIQNSVLVLSSGERVAYGKLIFADGTTGFGSRYQRHGKRNIAMQLICEGEFKEEIQIHFGVAKHGYGWVSTYNGTTNIGLTDVFNPKTDYKKAFADFMNSVGIDGDMHKLTAAFTPIGVRKAKRFGNVYFVGDAVGACDPLTLSGLRYAIQSGERCAEAITKGKAKIYISFVRRLKIRFALMRLMQKVFYIKSTLFLVFSVGCKVAGGFISRVFNNYFVNKK